MKVFVSIPKNSTVMNIFLPNAVKKDLEDRFDVTYSPLDRQLTNDEIAVYAKDADAILSGWGHCMYDAEKLAQTSVKLIAHTGGTVGQIVDQKIYDKGFKVISGNDLYADSVAEGVLTYMLMALRKLPDFVEYSRRGEWRPDGPDGETEGLLDQTVGIIGMGAIAKRVIKLLRMFHVKLKLYSGYPIDEAYLKENDAQQVSLDEIFSTCKVVSVHSSLTERTRGMIGKEQFDLLQDGALFVNTSRGAIIREDDMVEALKENRFRAVLDVYCKEPLEPDHVLRSMKNVYCLPHIAGPSHDRRPQITLRLADDIARYGRGEGLKLEISAELAARMTK